MSDFEAVLTDHTIVDLETLPIRIRLQVTENIASLARGPLPPRPGIRKLKGYRPPLYRLRAGDYRILYRVGRNAVTVIRVINRRDLDRTLAAI